MANFRKNKTGEWVVFGSVEEVCVGKVRVARKDGSVRSVAVTSIGKPFRAEGRMMVYGYIGESKAPAEPPPAPEPVCWDSPASSGWGREKRSGEDSDGEYDAEMAF
jgi:hypothetical protein